MTTKQKVLNFLRQHPTTFSGEKLAQLIGVSRTAVWKAVRELEKDGYQIAHHANGYQYLPSDVLENQQLASNYLAPSNIFLTDVTESTMKDAKLAAMSEQATPALFLAETQTGGHGRFGRPFFSPKGQVYMSLLLNPDQSFEELPQYTVLAAVAVALAIDEVTGKHSEIKWVNDIYLEGKKVCGILSEATSDFETGHIKHVILGMGINFSLLPEKFPADLRDKAGAIFPDEQPTTTRNHFIHLIWQNFFELLAALPDEHYLAIYRQKSFVLGKTVEFTQQGVTYTGTATAISKLGELIVETPQGTKTLSSGEISLQAIH